MSENKTNETPKITKYDCAHSCAIWLQDIIPAVLKREKCLTPEYRFPLPLSKTHTLFVALVTKNATFDQVDVEFISDSTLRLTVEWEPFFFYGFIEDFARIYYHLPMYHSEVDKDNPITVEAIDVVDDIINLFCAAHGLPIDFFDNDD
jgi:hypothetical protein